MSSYIERLENMPSDPGKAENYSELLALWKERGLEEYPDDAQLKSWDARVCALLTLDERADYLDESKLAGRTEAAGKYNRLSHILLGRHSTFVNARLWEADASLPIAAPDDSKPLEEAPQEVTPAERDRGEHEPDQQTVTKPNGETEKRERHKLRSDGQ
jgi:hypothetical protein